MSTTPDALAQRRRPAAGTTDRVDNGVNSPDGLDHSFDALRDMVTADAVDVQYHPDLKDYLANNDNIRSQYERQADGSLKLAVDMFAFRDPKM